MRNLQRFWQSSILRKIPNALFPPNPSIIVSINWNLPRVFDYFDLRLETPVQRFRTKFLGLRVTNCLSFVTHRNGFSKNYLPSSQKLFLFFHRSFHLDLLRMIDLCVEYHGISKLIRPLHWIVYLTSTKVQGHLAALTRSHLIGDHPSGLIKEQTTETMDPSPKTKGLQPYSHQWNLVLVGAARLPKVHHRLCDIVRYWVMAEVCWTVC